MNKKMLSIFAIIAGIFLLGTGAAYASNDAVPGDLLYPIDLAVEDIHGAFIFNPVSKANHAADVLAERIEELDGIANDAAIEALEAALARISEHATEMEEKKREMEENCNSQNCDEGEKERVNNRIEDEEEDHLETMEQTRESLTNKFGEDGCAGACGNIEDTVETLDDNSSESETDDTGTNFENGDNGNQGNGN